MIRSVLISEEAYKQMLRFVLEYANPERPYRLWREVIGWLIGTIEGETIKVLKAIPMTSGSSIFVEMADYSIIQTIAEEAEKNNAMIVGWFHSHPSFGFFLSSIDIRTQRNQQSLFANAIAIVCDPTKISLTEPGMHVYQVYMGPGQARDYRELEIRVEAAEQYPSSLEKLFLEMGISRSFSEVIAYEDLSALYALEGISAPPELAIKLGQLLPSEANALPFLKGEYSINEPLQSRKECFVQLQISNTGEGIAWGVDLNFNPEPDFKLKSMYPHRIIDYLNYDSTVIETFKILPRRTGELTLPGLIIHYRTSEQKRNQLHIPPLKVQVLK